MKRVDDRADSDLITAPGAALSVEVRSLLDETLSQLVEGSSRWIKTENRERIAIIDQLLADLREVANEWVETALSHKRASEDRYVRGQEWMQGPVVVAKLLKALQKTLVDAENAGTLRRSAPLRERSGRHGEQAVVPIFPSSNYDRLSAQGTSVEVWLQPGVAPGEGSASGSSVGRPEGGIALVLGAGNVSSIPATDSLERLFVNNQVVLLKLNPVNDYLLPFLSRGLAALIERGFLRILPGGADVGAYLSRHPQVDHVHLTGSQETFDAVLYGTGKDGRDRKLRGTPLLEKTISAELGDLSPVIIVPGPWSPQDLRYQAHHLTSMLVDNAGCDCCSPRLLVQQSNWPLRNALLEELNRTLGKIRPRFAYYPGARKRWQELVDAHPEARPNSRIEDGYLPWTLITDLDPLSSDPCFELEPFCSVVSEVTLASPDPAMFLDEAVEFVNERLWGSLSATILVHPATLRDGRTAAALMRAIEDLQYGTVAVNNWSGLSWSLAKAPWGGFPGRELHDIRSGIGFVHNPLMLTGIEKTVLRAPFRTVPTPPWFALNKRYDETARNLFKLELGPNPVQALKLAGSAIGGWL